jgi:hypothetical protein
MWQTYLSTMVARVDLIVLEELKGRIEIPEATYKS